MNPDEPRFIEIPLATSLNNMPKGNYIDVWQAQWRRWRFMRRKASNLTEGMIDDVLR